MRLAREKPMWLDFGGDSAFAVAHGALTGAVMAIGVSFLALALVGVVVAVPAVVLRLQARRRGRHLRVIQGGACLAHGEPRCVLCIPPKEAA